LKYLAVTLVLALSACGQAPRGYPAGSELAFKQSCQATARQTAAAAGQPNMSGITEYCDCVWARVSTDIPYAEFAAYERMTPSERASSQTQQKFVEFARACQPRTTQHG
jgi:hypothetical protein